MSDFIGARMGHSVQHNRKTAAKNNHLQLTLL